MAKKAAKGAKKKASKKRSFFVGNLGGAQMGHPNFFARTAALPRDGVKPNTRGRRHPGQRARRQSALRCCGVTLA
jgi:hypothetical protein